MTAVDALPRGCGRRARNSAVMCAPACVPKGSGGKHILVGG